MRYCFPLGLIAGAVVAVHGLPRTAPAERRLFDDSAPTAGRIVHRLLGAGGMAIGWTSHDARDLGRGASGARRQGDAA